MMHRIFVFMAWFLAASPLFSKCVLVTGGAGFIGSHVNEMLYQQGYDTIVLDNLVNGDRRAVSHGVFIQGNIGNSQLLDEIFMNYKVDAVMHFAAFLEVGESVINPLKYYKNNVAETLSLLDAMSKNHVESFIFSSSCTIFGNEDEEDVMEDHKCEPISPYGKSKLMIETILNDLNHAHGLRFCALRYFNAAGGDPDGYIKNYKTKEATLIPAILHRVIRGENSIRMFGNDYPTHDGTCIRDYIHVYDIARAHVLALERLLNGGDSTSYNLGNGKGYTVKEVISTVERVLGKKIDIIEESRRLGDPPRMVANAEKIKRELGWSPVYPRLEDMIEHAWMALQH